MAYCLKTGLLLALSTTVFVPQEENYYGYTRTAARWTHWLRAVKRHELAKRHALVQSKGPRPCLIVTLVQTTGVSQHHPVRGKRCNCQHSMLMAQQLKKKKKTCGPRLGGLLQTATAPTHHGTPLVHRIAARKRVPYTVTGTCGGAPGGAVAKGVGVWGWGPGGLDHGTAEGVSPALPVHATELKSA